jgi:hypothetical protein
MRKVLVRMLPRKFMPSEKELFIYVLSRLCQPASAKYCALATRSRLKLITKMFSSREAEFARVPPELCRLDIIERGGVERRT